MHLFTGFFGTGNAGDAGSGGRKARKERGGLLSHWCSGFARFFTLKLLGFISVLYEGSFFEWSNAPGTPVETSKPQSP